MIGNGPFKLESARSDQEIVLVRNDEWDGDVYGDTEADSLDKITFEISADVDTAYNAFEAGEGDTATIPPAGRRGQGELREPPSTSRSSAPTTSRSTLDDPRSVATENLKLRQAISLAIDREEINEAVYEGTRTIATGITPPASPASRRASASTARYDPEPAQAAFDEWEAEGNALDEPIQIQFNAGAGHEPTSCQIIDRQPRGDRHRGRGRAARRRRPTSRSWPTAPA